MSIEKKSLINTLKTTKKVNITVPATNEGSTSRKVIGKRAVSIRLRRTAKAR